jgi:hypothetical protein
MKDVFKLYFQTVASLSGDSLIVDRLCMSDNKPYHDLQGRMQGQWFSFSVLHFAVVIYSLQLVDLSAIRYFVFLAIYCIQFVLFQRSRVNL